MATVSTLTRATRISNPEDQSKLRSASHNAYFAGLQVKPGRRAITTDVCAPISRLPGKIVALDGRVDI